MPLSASTHLNWRSLRTVGFVRAANRAFGRGHERQKLVASTRCLRVYPRIRFGKLRPKEHWCFVPALEHGSGTGDHWHGGKGRRSMAL